MPMMRTIPILAGVLALSACVGSPGGETARAVELPEAVRAIVAPGQDLRTARLRPEDNCYWYDHAGPVETTPLPLRALRGGQICAESPT